MQTKKSYGLFACIFHGEKGMDRFLQRLHPTVVVKEFPGIH